MTGNEAWMQGPYLVRQALANSIRINMTPIHEAMREQWGISQSDFQVLDKIEMNEPSQFSTNDTSLVTCSVMTSNGFARTDIDENGAQSYQVKYRCRVYVFIRTGETQDGQLSGYDAATRYRDFMGTVVRASLLQNVSLHRQDMELKQETMTEDFAPPDVAKGDRWVAMMFLEFDVVADESMVEPKIGTTGTITHDTALIH